VKRDDIPGCLHPGLLERVDDANALEVFESRQVLRVQNLNASFDTCREDQGVPERRSSREMEFLGAGQVAVGGQDERQKIPELTEAIPGVRRGESLLVKLARSREKLSGYLPQENAVPSVGNKVEGDLLSPNVSLITGVDKDVRVNCDHAVPLG
jgi:hypothetical protein